MRSDAIINSLVPFALPRIMPYFILSCPRRDMRTYLYEMSQDKQVELR